MNLETRIRDEFRDQAERAEDALPAVDEVFARARRQRLRTGVLAASVVAALVSVALVVIPTADTPQVEIIDQPPAPVELPALDPDLLDQHAWQPLPAGLLDDEYRAARDPATNVTETLVWTGQEAVVWLSTGAGAAYDLQADRWRPVASPPEGLADGEGQAAVWTGRNMIVWGGRDASSQAAIYDPKADTWRQSATAPIDPTLQPIVVWTGHEMLVWGGSDGGVLRPDRLLEGAAYDPQSDTWRTLAEAPLRDRRHPTAVWTGQEMIVWGGQQPNNMAESTGAAYDPQTDTWRELAHAPVSGYFRHSAVWTGQEMIVWGWVQQSTAAPPENETAAYDPISDEWRMLSPAPFEGDRTGNDVGGQAAVWAGTMMLGWSGTLDDAGPLVLAFDPDNDQWHRLAAAPAPEWYHPRLAWTGTSLLVRGVPVDPDNSGAQLHFGDDQQ